MPLEISVLCHVKIMTVATTPMQQAVPPDKKQTGFVGYRAEWVQHGADQGGAAGRSRKVS